MKNTIKDKSRLDTPCIILDLDVLDGNLRKMQNLANRYGKKLRPHAKTHKCSALSQMQIEMGAVGACVAKVSEAEALVNAGVSGILITGPVSTATKIHKLIKILKRDQSLMVVVDHRDSIDLLSTALANKGLSMDVLLDIDVGLNRTGVLPAKALDLATYILSRKNLRLRGIQAYAGHIQHIPSYNSRKSESYKCLEMVVPIFRELKAMSEHCTIFSSSGTGTADIDLIVPEITELQVGSYACMDTEYLAIGSGEDSRQFLAFPPALRLLTTVVSVNHEGFVTVDAGLKSLYKDGGKPQVITPENSSLEYDWFGDEYGRITSTNNSDLPGLGTVLELVTSHCDPTINLFDNFFLTRGKKVTGTWPIDLRGRSQ